MRISRAREEKFFLVDFGLPEELDPDRTGYVVVRAATAGDVERRAALTEEASRIFHQDIGAIEIKQKWNIEEQRRLETYLTLSECSIEVEHPSKIDTFVPAFTFAKNSQGVTRVDMTEVEFKARWDNLPVEVTDAMHRCVLEMNPQWDNRPKT